MNIYKYIGRKIKLLREKTNMTQKELAIKSNLTLYKVKKIEDGNHKITLSTLCIICNVFKIHPKSLFQDYSKQ